MTINITASEEEAPEQDLLNLELPPGSTVSLLKESVQDEIRIPKSSQHLYHNGQLLLDDTKTMEELNIADGDMLSLHIRDMSRSTAVRQQPAGRPVQGTPQRPTRDDPEMMRLQILGDPRLRQQVQQQRPELAAALDNPQRFTQMWQEMAGADMRERALRQQRIADLNADPFDVDAQTRIAEMIREERVQENLQNAIEHNPEGMMS